MQRLIFRVVLAALTFAIAPHPTYAELARGPESFSQTTSFNLFEGSNCAMALGSADAGECGEIDFIPESCRVSPAVDGLSCRE